MLKTHNLKKTSARLEILDVLCNHPQPLSADEVAKLTSARCDLSTVYRNLNCFVEKGICKAEISPSQERIFSLIGDKDEHVLVCTECKRRVPLEGCPYEEANERIEEATGFHLIDHNTEIYGICPDCLKKESK